MTQLFLFSYDDNNVAEGGMTLMLTFLRSGISGQECISTVFTPSEQSPISLIKGGKYAG